MGIKIRLARGGSKKRPFYRVVAADSRMPRDGRFIEKLGTYNPLLPKDSPERVKLNVEKIQAWIAKGAQLSDRISRLLEVLSVLPVKSRNNPKKGLKHKATEEREAAKAEKVAVPSNAEDIEGDSDKSKGNISNENEDSNSQEKSVGGENQPETANLPEEKIDTGSETSEEKPKAEITKNEEKIAEEEKEANSPPNSDETETEENKIP